MAREMKDSGYLWIGEIPKDWIISQVKRVFSIGRGRVIAKSELIDNGYPVYSSQTMNNGVLGYISTYDFDRSQLTWTTDGVNAGTVFLREGKHNCTNVCGTLMPKEEGNDLRYLQYALSHIAFYHKRADINGYKIMNNEMANIEIILPPFLEQTQIADYLDTECSRIDAVIARTRTSIEEYKKLKQSVITQAVTEGIRPGRKMKDSGIEGIETIREDWNIQPLKTIAIIMRGGSPRPIEQYISDDETGYNWIRIGDSVKGSKYISSTLRKIIHEGLSKTRLIKKGSLILSNSMSFGQPYILDIDGCIHDGWVAFSDITINKEYLYYFLLSEVAMIQFKQQVAGGVVLNLNVDKIGSTKIAIPNKEEQIEIIQYLDEKIQQIDALIEKKEMFLSELDSYKKSLIYEYVTGKKEVPV